jgi:hypothetical protein
MQPDAELLGNPQRVVAPDTALVAVAYGVGMPFHAKAGEKVDALDLDALLLD